MMVDNDIPKSDNTRGSSQDIDADPMARTVIIPSPSNRKTEDSVQSEIPVRVDKRAARRNVAVPKSGDSFDPAAYPNPLIRAAGPILMSAVQLKDTLTNPDAASVRRRMSEEVRAFDSNAKAFGVSIPQTNAARYVLCTFIDEIVMSTPWGAKSGWSRRSLLSEFYGETSGGTKVFTVIDRAMAEPGNYSLLLELSYLVIGLGFEGQYRVQNSEGLAALQAELYRVIRTQNPVGESELSPNWRGEQQDKSAQFMKIVPLWMISLGGILLMAVIYFSYALALNNVREPVYVLAVKIARQGPPPVINEPPPAVPPFDLESRLQPYVGNGLDVRVDDGVALISLQGRVGETALFRSGDTRLHRRSGPMLEKVAGVLIELQTGVTITGHTDGKGRIISNQKLSERRADTVFGELVFRGVDENLIETRGFGSSDPVVLDEKTEQDRSRNRRVEIRFRVPDNTEFVQP